MSVIAFHMKVFGEKDLHTIGSLRVLLSYAIDMDKFLQGGQNAFGAGACAFE